MRIARVAFALVFAAGCNSIFGFERGTRSNGGLPCDALSGLPSSACDDGFLCMFHTCQRKCTADADCDDGFRCLSVTGGPGLAACADSDATCDERCPQGVPCDPRDNRCRTACNPAAATQPCKPDQNCNADAFCVGGPRHDPPHGGDSSAPDARSDAPTDSAPLDANGADVPTDAPGLREYIVDADTVLLDHFNGSTTATIGAFQPAGACTSTALLANSSFVTGQPGLNQALAMTHPTTAPAGANTYVEYQNEPLSLTAGTLELWLYLLAPASGDQSIVLQGPPGNPAACANVSFSLVLTASGKIRAAAPLIAPNNGFTVTSAASLSASTWTHIAVTWGPQGAFVYINGVQSGTDVATGSPQGGFGGALHTASTNSAPVAQALIDELRVSKVQRTQFNVR